jgi:hypothetical protein
MDQITRELMRQVAGDALAPEQLRGLIRAGYVYRNGEDHILTDKGRDALARSGVVTPPTPAATNQLPGGAEGGGSGSEQVMQSAGYFRDQAALCVEIARHISDPGAMESLRASAARHLVKADDVEKRNTAERSQVSQVRPIPPLRDERSGVGLSCLVDPVAPLEPAKPVPKPSPEGTPEFWTHVIH